LPLSIALSPVPSPPPLCPLFPYTTLFRSKHPSSEEYELRNKSYWYSLEDGENFWELFSRYVYSEYSITEDTPVIINGDAAPWIRAGVDYFENAVYTYDRYHLKKW